MRQVSISLGPSQFYAGLGLLVHMSQNTMNMAQHICISQCHFAVSKGWIPFFRGNVPMTKIFLIVKNLFIYLSRFVFFFMTEVA